ncbi:hypothetical protein PV326_004822 [Microctonus aethiopoides]|nr:hypothetical protein PV326_004822 [Microctonus aethiopoides]
MPNVDDIAMMAESSGEMRKMLETLEKYEDENKIKKKQSREAQENNNREGTKGGECNMGAMQEDRTREKRERIHLMKSIVRAIAMYGVEV